MKNQVVISLVMGSCSDSQFMSPALELLKKFDVGHEIKIVSAHRTPNRLYEYSQNLQKKGVKVVIAGAGGSAHLPGMIASITSLPVLGVPIPSTNMMGMDSLLSIVQMPKGVPVGTLAIGKVGAYNASILALRILSLQDASLLKKLEQWTNELSNQVPHEPTM